MSRLVISSPCVRRLRNCASVRPARISVSSSTPRIRTARPTKFQMKMMRAMRERSSARNSPSGFVVPVADAIEGLDRVELAVDVAELFAEPLDVAVDCSVVDIDLIVIGSVHQLIAAFDVAGTLRERLQDKKLGDCEANLFALPSTGVAVRIKREFAANDRLLVICRLPARRARAGAPQQRLHPLAEQA